MAFNVPVQNPLTQTQSEALGKIGALNNLLLLPFKRFLTLPKSQQISLLDYLTKIVESTLGSGYIETLMMKWVNDLFDKNSVKLEKAILKAMAEALDAKPFTIKNGRTNLDWLTENVQPELHAAMEVLKAIIVKKIIILIYGPRNRMKLFLPLNWPPNNNPYLQFTDADDLSENDYLDNASLSDSMFTTVNTVSNSYGDTEYNIVKLREQLEKGQITFTISCQDVKINLPESIIDSADQIIDDNIKVFLQGQTVGGGSVTYQNPSKVFVQLNTYVDNETQRINSEENASAVKKSWIRILVDKIINLLPIVLYPVLNKIFDKINQEVLTETGVNPNLTVQNTLGILFALKNDIKNESLFTKNSTFYRILFNALYALLLSIILKKVIKEVTKIITKALAKRRAAQLQRKFKRIQARAKLIQEQAQEIEKKAEALKSLAIVKQIFTYVT